jgi:hypothetical protein
MPVGRGQFNRRSCDKGPAHCGENPVRQIVMTSSRSLIPRHSLTIFADILRLLGRTEEGKN